MPRTLSGGCPVTGDESWGDLVLINELHVTVHAPAGLMGDAEAEGIREVTLAGLRAWATDATERAAGRFTVTVAP